MYALFDEGGKFLAGRVISEADSSLQIELDSGKRVKVKSAHLLLEFTRPLPAELMASARQLAEQIDLDLAWEFAPASEFGFTDLARDYFDANAGAEQQAAALLCLFGAPHYFRRVGKGRFKKAPEEAVKAALLGIERKRQQAARIDDWAEELAAGRCPAPIREQLYKILFRPDKNAPEYKAVVAAARQSQRAPLDLLVAAGAIDSPYQFHWRRFLYEQFPNGTSFAIGAAAPAAPPLPRADVAAFSIDDSATTEIDDALSVRGLGTGSVVFGIHIAAPGLAFAPDSVFDKVARERLSTVYMPGWKLTMLPEQVVQACTLQAGRDCPAVSLYLRFDETTLEVTDTQTRLELIPISANLRHDELDALVTEESLCGPAAAEFPFALELAFAFRLARHLKLGRERARGKPENFNRPDYHFELLGNEAGREPNGNETVRITTRRRGSALDLIVAEAMILANSTWGRWLEELRVPAVYRGQASLAPGVKVRMSTRAMPHAGIGVTHYTWATSPLRRYVDLVNQWQIIACTRHGHAALLAAPFKPKETTLFSIVSAFEETYGAYNDFQARIERYWTLRCLEQAGMTEMEATALGNGMLRADMLPLVFRALGAEGLPRGARVNVRITGTDLLTLDLHAKVTGRLAEAGATSDEEAADTEARESTGPLALAIEVDDDGAEQDAASALTQSASSR